MKDRFELLKEKFGVSRETYNNLSLYVQSLLKWNQKINLVSKACDEDELWNRHVVDAVQLYKFFHKDKSIIDFGSGGGVPGLILSIMGLQVTLIEKNFKKIQFLKQIKSLLDLKVGIINSDIRECDLGEVSYITCRGVASLVEVINLTSPWFYKNVIYILPRGETFEEEVQEAREMYDFSYKCYESYTNFKSKIVVLNHNG